MGKVISFGDATKRREDAVVEKRRALLRINELEGMIHFKQLHIDAIREAGKEMGGSHEIAAAALVRDENELLQAMVNELNELKAKR